MKSRKCSFPLLLITAVLANLAFFAPEAEGVEFTAFGHWMFGVNAGNVYGQDKRDLRDHFQALQRLRTQFGFKSDHGLNGQIQLEMGKTNWGQASSGGALGADDTLIKLRYAWLEWDTPIGDTKVRMGLQPINMPSFVNGSPLYSEDSAAITLAHSFTGNVDATAFWARASAANELPGRKNRLEGFNTLDFFGLSVPVKGDGFRWTPYGMFANAGVNSYGYRSESANGECTLTPYKNSLRTVANNLAPVGGLDVLANRATARQLNPWANAWWGGVGGDLDMFEPWKIAAEAAYGEANFGSANVLGRNFDMRRAGWYGAFLVECSMEWMIPGLLGWYSSGDDDNPWNGSERMPVGKSANRDWKVLTIAYDGAPFCPEGGAQIISPNGTMIGTWGLVGRLRDISFLKNLKHTIRAGYVCGSNNPDMVTDNPLFTDKKPGGYLTTKDEAIEVDFETHFKLYENLTLILDMDWLRVNWDKSVWDKIDNDLRKDFYRIGFTAYYHF